MKTILILQEDGTITSPPDEIGKSAIENSDPSQIIDLDGLIILSHKKPETPALAAKISQMMAEAGLDMETMLQNLRVERERYAKENYDL